ncbi:unnamed protein product [Arctia plantaginis]|uniref:Uncharacterized protein n=1 Tax=Arctia plantaginis TaxID=874455 RepID=A0A8S1B393_ARCPL|nr:unnamed protein product [Arctia plantaginis]
MDFSKDSASVKNPNKLDGESDKSKNNRTTGTLQRQTDNVENLFTSTQSLSFVPLNGPWDNDMNSMSDNEPVPQTSRYNENTLESNKIPNPSSQPQMCNKVSKCNSDQADSDSNVYDNGPDSSHNVQLCQRHKKCIDKAESSSSNLPSTSNTGKTADNSDSSTFKENRKRPSSLKLNRIDDDSSSDTGNDDYSLGSEDGCIYTYRGGEHLADLPSSFFSLDMGLPLDNHLPLLNYPVPQQGAAGVRDQGSRASSPDMEFLEMDFDPGPSCEVDTGDESSPDVDLEVAGNIVDEIEPVIIRGTSPEYVPVVVPQHNPVVIPPSAQFVPHGDSSDLYSYSVPSTSRSTTMGHGDASDNSNSYSFGPYITHVNTRGEQMLVRRTMAHGPISLPINLHVSSGNLVSPREMLNLEDEQVEGSHAYQINQGSSMDSANLSSALYHIKMARRLMSEKTKSDAEAQVSKASDTSGSSTASSSTSSAGCVAPPRCMIWSESEACDRQVTQISTSACGATAVVNVFNALGVPVNLERIGSAVGTRQRANNAPIPRYLLSRAVAGCTASDLVSGIHRASDGLVTARFFPTYPERAISLSHWLADWITLGAVPILTLNLQAGCEGEIPDAWHHQMVFGVSSRGVYLCNPVECVRETALWPHLISPSVLLVRTRDVLSRFTAYTDLTPLMAVPDRRFQTFNVLGQVVNVIREYRAIGWGEFGTRTRHIRIPASYQAGVTVAALTGSEAHRRLVAAPHLPVLTPPADP